MALTSLKAEDAAALEKITGASSNEPYLLSVQKLAVRPFSWCPGQPDRAERVNPYRTFNNLLSIAPLLLLQRRPTRTLPTTWRRAASGAAASWALRPSAPLRRGRR